MRIRLLAADEVSRALSDDHFVSEWDQLWRACPWATASQTPAFTRIWYAVYKPTFTPVIVEGRAPDGALVGLLSLAFAQGQHELFPAGTHHAEYQTWIARPKSNDDFILAALDTCARELSARHLRFQFLPKGTPIDWSHRPTTGIRTAQHAARRGLISLDYDAIDTALGKESNKSRFRRLQRLGPVALERLTTRAQLETVIGEIMTQCDFRQAAENGTMPFREDPEKREFYLRMMEEPGLLHAVVLKAGTQVIASHAGVAAPDSVSLGLITCSALHAAYSPGKLLLLFLAQHLSKEGYRTFDLTPRAGYLDRSATHFDDVDVLDIFFTRRAYATYTATRSARQGGSRALRAAGIDRDLLGRRIQNTAKRLNRLRLPGAVSSALRIANVRCWSRREFRLYQLPLAASPKTEDGKDLRRDSVEDLLLYRPSSSTDLPVKDFIGRAMLRLEQGQHVYSFTVDGILVHYSWLQEQAEQAGSDFDHVFVLPARSAVLWDDHTRPNARGRGLHTASIRRRARDAVIAGHAAAFIGVRADNRVSRHNIEKLGFTYWASGWAEYRLGRLKLWISHADPGYEATTQESLRTL